jgi:hypothetical protein
MAQWEITPVEAMDEEKTILLCYQQPGEEPLELTVAEFRWLVQFVRENKANAPLAEERHARGNPR